MFASSEKNSSMYREYPSIYRRMTATILSLCLFFMVISACPVRGLMTRAFVPPVELSKQSNSSVVFADDDLRCSEETVTQAGLPDLPRLTNSGLPLSVFLTVLSLFLSLSVFGFQPFRKGSEPTLVNPVPLFLRNRSIII